MADENLNLNLTVDAAEAATSVKDLRDIIRAAKNEALKFKEGSAEFIKFSNIASQANDRLKAVNETLVGLDPGGRARAFGQLGSTIAGGFAAAQAAAALFGAESEDLQKTLLKVQAATAFAQGIQQLQEFGKAFRIVNAIVAANPLFTMLAVVTAVGAAIAGLVMEWRRNNSEAAQLERTITAVKEQNESLQIIYDNQITLLQAQGGQEEKIFDVQRKKLEAKIKEIELQVKLNNLKAAEAGEITFLDSLVSAFVPVVRETDRANARMKEFTDANKALNLELETLKTQLEVININEEKFQQKTLKDAEDRHKKIVDDEKRRIDELMKLAQEQNDAEIQQELLKIEFEQRARLEKEKQEQQDWLDAIAEEEMRGQVELQQLEKKLKNEQELEKFYADSRLSIQQSLLSSLASLGQILFNNAEKADKFGKAIAVADLAVKSAQAIAGAVAQAQSVPFPGNIAAIASGVAAVLANIAQAKKLLQSAPGVQAPQLNIPSAGAASNGVNINNVATGSTLLNPDGTVNIPETGTDQRVFVLETDITDTQRKVNSTQTKAKIG